MKIGVFVGSFDPVHIGHTSIMNYLIEEKIVDKVLAIATGNYWHKQNITDTSIRLQMLDLIGNENIIIDKTYNKVVYTHEILNALKKENPNDEIYLVVGADNANNIYKWKNYEEVLENGIIIINRDDIKINLKSDKLIIINKKFGNISSTMIRGSVEENKALLDKRVYNFIKKNNLYKGV